MWCDGVFEDKESVKIDILLMLLDSITEIDWEIEPV